MSNELEKENVDNAVENTAVESTEANDTEATSAKAVEPTILVEETIVEQAQPVYTDTDSKYSTVNSDIPKEGPGAMAITSLVLGIFSVVCSFASFAIVPGIISIISGVVGLILSIKVKKTNPNGIATGGFITSIVGIVLAVIGIILAAVFFSVLMSIAGAVSQDPSLLPYLMFLD